MNVLERWWKKLLRVFMGEFAENTYREEDKPFYSDEKTRRKRIRYPMEEASVKITHHYPKKGKFRFPVNVDDHPIQAEQWKPVDIKGAVTEWNKGEKKENEHAKQSYFQGENFTYEPTPSPIFGYKHLPLHHQSLKKQAVAEEQVNREEETEKTQSESLVEKNTPVKPKERKNETESSQKEPIPFVETERQPSEEKSKLSETSQQQHKSFPKNQSNEKQSSRQTETKITRIPYNVMMYPTDKKQKHEKKERHYSYPSYQLLKNPVKFKNDDHNEIDEKRKQLEATLRHFNVLAKVVDVTKGPAITRFEVQPQPGVKVNKITNLSDDIKLALAVKDLRIEAPIPGKNAIGIEVPNEKSRPVFLKEILTHPSFQEKDSPLTVAMGLDISGKPIISDLKSMPHGLIAGATGSGKSVCINAMLISLLYKATPEEVRFILIDPKMVELASYKDIPHLVTPVIHDAKSATAALKWAVQEMESRYEKLAASGVRDIKRYNEKNSSDKMPYIVIVIDELADLMMVSPQDVEDAICRIAQKARAAGIHLLVATQRPSVDVITGLIKANIPSRTAFAVSSQTDSRTILDMSGAERLIGKGDMLFHENGRAKPIRVQGAFVSDEEIDAVTEMVKSRQKPHYLFTHEDLSKKMEQENEDELFEEACLFVAEEGRASSSLLQRRFSIGYNRAAKLIDMMEARGIVSEAMGSKPRRVFMTKTEIQEKFFNTQELK